MGEKGKRGGRTWLFATMNKFLRTFPAWVILAVGLCHVPARFTSLDSFEWPKRLVWAGFLVLVMPFCIGGRANRQSGGLNNGIGRIALALCGWMLLRSVLRPDPWVELETLALWLLPVLAFYAGLRSGFSLRPIVIAMAWAALIQMVIMLLQYIGFDPLFSATTGSIAAPSGRMIGTIGYQNQAAAFVGISAGFASLWIRSVPVALLLAASSLMVIALTGCRGTTVAIVVASALAWAVRIHVQWGKTSLRRGALIMLVSFLFACTLASAFPPLRERVICLTTPQGLSASLGMRQKMMAIACRQWLEHPLVGWGAGAFAHQYMDRLGDELPEVKTGRDTRILEWARHAHNDYLQFGVEFGLVGWCLVVVGSAMVFRLVLRAPAHGTLPDIQAGRAAMVFVSVYMALEAVASFPWQLASVGPFAGFLLGLSVSGFRDQVPVNEPGRMDPAAIFMSVIAVFVFLVAVESVRLDNKVMTCKDSESAWQMARRLQGSHPWMHRQRAMLGTRLAANGDYDRAVSVLAEATTGYRDISVLNNLGHSLAQSGRWEEASKVYQVWCRTGLQHEDALQNLITAYAKSGAPGKAVVIMDRLVVYKGAGDPLFRTAEFNEKFAYLLLEAGHTNQALSALESFREKRGAEAMTPRLLMLLDRCQSQ